MLEIPIGINNENELDMLPLPGYVLITGCGGGNRSGLLCRLVLSGITKYTPDELQYWIYDDEMHSFDDFKRYRIPHITKVSSEESREATEAFTVSLYEEVQRRFKLLLQTNRHSFQEYYKETGMRLAPQIMVIIDFADDFHRHFYECKENIRNMMVDIALLSQALDISLVFCFSDYRIINWGYGCYPNYFPYRVSMKQDNFSAEQTLNYKFQTDDPWQSFGTFWINWPQPHPVRPPQFTGDLEEVLKRHFEYSSTLR